MLYMVQSVNISKLNLKLSLEKEIQLKSLSRFEGIHIPTALLSCMNYNNTANLRKQRN